MENPLEPEAHPPIDAASHVRWRASEVPWQPEPAERRQDNKSPDDTLRFYCTGASLTTLGGFNDSGTRSLVRVLPALLLLFCGLQTCFAQAEHPVTGRRIAPVMGMGGAPWLDRSERELEEAPDKALDSIGIRTGMTVADIGAGTGYFSL